MAKSWELEDGLRLVRALQMECRAYGYHLALGGGVLNNGRSDKDLDLYFLPLDNPRLEAANPEGLLAWLAKLWGEPGAIGKDYGLDDDPPPFDDVQKVWEWAQLEVKPIPRRKDSNYKYKLKFLRASSDDRIDVFIL